MTYNAAGDIVDKLKRQKRRLTQCCNFSRTFLIGVIRIFQMCNLRRAWFDSLSEYYQFDFVSQLEGVVKCVTRE
jgi:hypothetical protein